MLARLLLLEELLADDACAALDAVHRRDRAIGREIEACWPDAPHRVLAWVGRRAAPGALDEVERGFRAARALLGLVGLGLGAALAAGVLYFDGASRVNVLTVLALLCALPAATTLVSTLLMLPQRWRQAIAPLAALQDAASVLSPGRALLRIARRVSPAHRERLERWQGRAGAGARVYGALSRAMALHASQIFAVAFSAGILAAFLARVTFSDLAFGWSTTLQTEPSALHAMTAALAAPWSPWLADAVPTADLVESTRYFRLDPAPPAGAAANLGGWWPFVAMCVAVYGLLPRIALYAISRLTLARTVLATAAIVPGVPELIYRLERDTVETRSTSVEHEGGERPTPAEAAAHSIAPGDCAAIAWGGVGLDEIALAEAVRQACGLRARTFHAGGGAASLESDRAAVDALADGPAAVAVVVKSWEPPLAELVDFLEDIRATLGPGRPIAIVAMAENPQATPDADALATWERRMANTGDPWLSVHAGGRGAADA